jgi:hypothetical protein
MTRQLLTSTIVVVSLLAGCSSTPPAPKSQTASATKPVDRYSKDQVGRLTYCVGLTDTAWSIATMKLAGKSKEEVRKSYANHPNPTLITAEIDEVFSNSISRAWDYSVQFFRDCAVNVANVATASTDTGAYCMQNAMLSGLAQEHKAAGMSKKQAYESLPIPGETPKALVDAVYKNSDDRANAMLNAWNTCIAPVTNR